MAYMGILVHKALFYLLKGDYIIAERLFPGMAQILENMLETNIVLAYILGLELHR